jgi:hypothetical protein
MKKLVIFFLVWTVNAKASFPEFFGASFSTSSIGNQSNLDPSDPSNNYYNPSLLAFSKKVNFLIQTTATQTQFNKISNIITTNTSTSDSIKTGNISNKYPDFFGTGIHISLPIGFEDHRSLGTLAFSIFMPVGQLLESNSGSPFLPEYVLYHSRYQRTSIFANFAHELRDDLAISIGSIFGIQASAEVDSHLSMNGGTYGSSSSARSKVAPSLGLILSATKKIKENSIYFTYQQEMQSNLHVRTLGEITSPAPLLFDSNIDSILYFDPHTFRIGGNYQINHTQIYAGLEYQLWSNYKAPMIIISKTSGVMQPSRQYETLNTRNTFNPHLGFKENITERWSYGLGFTYHQSPLSGDFSGSGNSIDSNSYIYTAGIQYKLVFWSKDVHLGTSFEYHELETKQVVKSPNEENGNSGSKIGAPGYTIGGKVLTGSFGIAFNF